MAGLPRSRTQCKSRVGFRATPVSNFMFGVAHPFLFGVDCFSRWKGNTGRNHHLVESRPRVTFQCLLRKQRQRFQIWCPSSLGDVPSKGPWVKTRVFYHHPPPAPSPFLLVSQKKTKYFTPPLSPPPLTPPPSSFFRRPEKNPSQATTQGCKSSEVLCAGSFYPAPWVN